MVGWAHCQKRASFPRWNSLVANLILILHRISVFTSNNQCKFGVGLTLWKEIATDRRRLYESKNASNALHNHSTWKENCRGNQEEIKDSSFFDCTLSISCSQLCYCRHLHFGLIAIRFHFTHRLMQKKMKIASIKWIEGEAQKWRERRNELEREKAITLMNIFRIFYVSIRTETDGENWKKAEREDVGKSMHHNFGQNGNELWRLSEINFSFKIPNLKISYWIPCSFLGSQSTQRRTIENQYLLLLIIVLRFCPFFDDMLW